MTKVNEKNRIDYIMRYEGGEITAKETLELFSHLLKTRLAWQLQGHYGRTASAFIEAGYLNENGKILKMPEEQQDYFDGEDEL